MTCSRIVGKKELAENSRRYCHKVAKAQGNHKASFLAVDLCKAQRRRSATLLPVSYSVTFVAMEIQEFSSFHYHYIALDVLILRMTVSSEGACQRQMPWKEKAVTDLEPTDYLITDYH